MLRSVSFYLGQNIHDHIAAVAHNFGAEAPFRERCVHYENVRAGDITEFARLAETNGMKALRAVNARVADKRHAAHDVAWRMNFGVYFYAEPVAEKSESTLERQAVRPPAWVDTTGVPAAAVVEPSGGSAA